MFTLQGLYKRSKERRKYKLLHKVCPSLFHSTCYRVCTLYCTVHSLSICFFPYHFFLVHFIMKKKVGVFAQKKGKRNYFIFFCSYIKICSCVINKSECKMSVGSIFCWLRVLEIHSLSSFLFCLLHLIKFITKEGEYTA